MSEDKSYDSFSEEVWDVLSRIDVSDHTDYIEKTGKRPEISYIAWHTAWSLLKRKFPASTIKYYPDMRHPDATVEVGIEVEIRRDSGHADVQTTSASLSVMDSWMNAIENPTARQVNDSRQRVLVKALAFAGLGLTLWSGDSVPIGTLDDVIDDEQLTLITDLIEKSETNEESFRKWADHIDDLSEMTVERFPKARALLEQKIIRKQKAEKVKK